MYVIIFFLFCHVYFIIFVASGTDESVLWYEILFALRSAQTHRALPSHHCVSLLHVLFSWLYEQTLLWHNVLSVYLLCMYRG